MSKKTWILISCLVLSLTLGLGGSLAYLTDSDTKVNTFTMGNVDIEVNENFGNDDEGGYGDGVESLYPGVTVKKEAWIKNTGDNDAYVWLNVAVPAAADLQYDFGDGNVQDVIQLEWMKQELADELGYTRVGFEPGTANPYYGDGQQLGEDFVWFYSAWDDVGREYHIYTYRYDHILKPGESTEQILKSVTLNPFVNKLEDGYYFIMNGGQQPRIEYELNGMQIIVSGHAIQVEGFKSWEDAYAAYGSQWGQFRVEANVDSQGKAYTSSATVNEYILLATGDEDSKDDVIAASGKDTVVTIVGGTYDIGGNYNPCAVWAYGDATVIIKDGRFWCNATSEFGNDHIDLIYAGSKKNGGGTIIIEGGEFGARGSTDYGENDAWLVNEHDATGKVLIKGGRFLNWNPAENKSEGEGTNFVAVGYTEWEFQDENGDWWYCVFPEDYSEDQVANELGRDDAYPRVHGTNTLDNETPTNPNP